MSVAVRLTTVLIFAAVSGCGTDAPPSLAADQSTVSLTKPNAGTGEVARSAGATPSKQPDSRAVAWQDRVDYDKWEPQRDKTGGPPSLRAAGRS